MALPDCFHCKYDEAGYPCRTSGGQSLDFEKIAAAIVAQGRTYADDFEGDPELARDKLDWVSDCEFEITEDHPDLLFILTLNAIDACDVPHDAAFVAAGLLENAVAKHGPYLIGKIEALAARSAKFRYVLSAIWGQSRTDADVWARICKAAGHDGRMDTDGRGPSDGSPVTVLSGEEATALLASERVTIAAAGLI